MTSVRFQGNPFSITVTQVYVPTTDVNEAEFERFCVNLFNFRFFSIAGRGIDLDYCDIEWFALEMNSDPSVVFEIASKYCISDSF